EVPVLASDLNARAARANGHADSAAFEDLIQAKRARILRRRIEVRPVRIGAVRRLRRGIEAEELLAGEEGVTRRDLDGAANAVVDAVQRALVANDESVVAVEKVRVLRRHELIFGKFD